MNKKAIIITTINQIENTSINKYFGLDYDIIIVGDLKTPEIDYIENKNITYISKNDTFDGFEKKLPFNHYCRKNLGYLYAISKGYQEIFDTDDDNYPISEFGNWNITYQKIISPNFPNILKLYTDKHIWPRGYPLEMVNQNQEIILSKDVDNSKIGIIQSLSNGEPDVDAIFRLTNQNYNPIDFYNGLAFVLERGIYTPANTQITFWIYPPLFHLLYIPVTVTFRFCDILKMYIAQRCMWEYDKLLCYISPVVEQKRNVHNLMSDFISEYPMYTQVFHLLNNTFNQIKLNGDKYDLLIIYQELYKAGIVKEEELDIVNSWLSLIN